MANPWKLTLLAMMVLTISAHTFAADAKGWYDIGCYNATFHLAGISAQLPLQEFILRWQGGSLMFNTYLEGRDWFDVSAQPCSVGTCQDVTKSKLQFQKIRRRHVSGKYQIDTNDQHFEGQYKVKYRHKGGQIICE